MDIQHDLLADYETRVVVPLLPLKELRVVIPRFNPVFEIERRQLALTPQFMAAIDSRQLGAPVGKLQDKRDKIVAAMDFLFIGY